MSVPVQLSSFDEFPAAFATTTTTVKPSSKANKTTVMSAKGSKQPTSMGKFGLKE
jgi:hypothetical protein